MKSENYGARIRELRLKMGLGQNDVAAALDVTPGYICNVENGRTAMSLRILTYYARLDSETKKKLLRMIEIWTE